MKSPSASHSRKAIASSRSSSGIGSGLARYSAITARTRAEHRRPVGDRAPHLDEQRLEPLGKLAAALGAVDPVDMELDQALADGSVRPRSRAVIRDQAALVVPRHADDRMGDEADPGPEGLDLAEGRVEQERHVLVEDADHRHLAARRRIGRHRFGYVDHGRPGLPLREERIGGADEGGQVVGAVDGKILEADAGEQVAGQRLEPLLVALAATEHAPGKADQPVAFGRLVAHPIPPDCRSCRLCPAS